MFFIIAIIQTVLHYLGITGIVLGIIAYLFGNYSRGQELVTGGIIFIILKYLIGFVYLPLIIKKHKIRKILIIDSATEIREIMKESLKKEWLIVETARDGKEGLEKLLKNKYDFVWLDIVM